MVIDSYGFSSRGVDIVSSSIGGGDDASSFGKRYIDDASIGEGG